MKPSRRSWVLVASAWLVALFALLTWLLQTPARSLREQLKVLQFWSLEICVALGLALGAVIVWDLVRGLDRRDGLRITMLAVVAVGLTLFVAPRTNRIYYDEQIYQNVGQSLADLKLAQMCNDGTVEYGRLQCAGGEYNKQPYAYPHLLSLVYRAFGVTETRAFVVNAIVMAATVACVYLLVLTLFGDRRAAFFAGLLMTLTPEQLSWSATAAVEPSASLAAAAAVLYAAHASRVMSTVALAATAVATAYAVQFRPESFLIVAVVGALLWRRGAALGRPTGWWVGLLSVALVAVHLGHMFAVRTEGWGTSHARLSLGYLVENLRVNGGFYLGDDRFPVIFTLLATLGLLTPDLKVGPTCRSFMRERMSLGLYFLSFFGIYLLFYAGSYDYGADVRYSLMTYPPLAALGGLGAARIVGWLERLDGRLPGQAVVTAGLAFHFLSYAPVVRATTEEAWAARADVRFARSLVPQLRGNSYVLTHNPGMFHVWGVNAGQMSLVGTNPSYLDYLTRRYAGGVYLHWNFWCNVPDPVQQELCRRALAHRRVETVREYRERDQRYAIYRFTP